MKKSTKLKVCANFVQEGLVFSHVMTNLASPTMASISCKVRTAKSVLKKHADIAHMFIIMIFRLLNT